MKNNNLTSSTKKSRQDCRATQISDSDDDNWFVPKSSKRRVTSTVHPFRETESAQPLKKDHHDESDHFDSFCEVDLESNQFKSQAGDEEEIKRKRTWSDITKMLPSQVRSKISGVDGTLSSEEDNLKSPSKQSYLPPFQMVGHIEDAGYDPFSKMSHSGSSTTKRSKGSVMSQKSKYGYESVGTVETASVMNDKYSETSSVYSTNSSVSYDSTSGRGDERYTSSPSNFSSSKLNGRKSCQPPYVLVPPEIRDFSANVNDDTAFEDSDGSWILQASSKRLVR